MLRQVLILLFFCGASLCLAEASVDVSDAAVLSFRIHSSHHPTGPNHVSVYGAEVQASNRLNFRLNENPALLTALLTAKVAKSSIVIRYEPSNHLYSAPVITSIEVQ